MSLSETYDPKVAEPKWQIYWQTNKIHAFRLEDKTQVFSIDTPPPTVSGMMHLGHALGYTQTDFIARYQRMRGRNVFYPFGFDDNGLATERYVEKKLKIKGNKMPRPEFIALCLEQTQEIEADLLRDFQSLGLACDWAWQYRTIDTNAQAVSQASFLDLIKQGRAYRKEAPIMWCPTCQTAIAQMETKDREQKSALHYIRVKTQTGKELVYATTRPELLPACVGISVHPQDLRYKADIGVQVQLPLINRSVPLTADTATDMEYGSGVVYYCTYGGVECIDWMMRHPDVIPIKLLNPDGKLNAQGGKYAGMTTREAREAILADLAAAGALVKSEPLTHTVNTHERCDTEIEYISSVQWFVNYLDLKETFLALGNKLQWNPPFMKARYDNWILGLRWDWCISRQRFFGVPFPVWYCKGCGNANYADPQDLPVDPTATQPKDPCSTCKGTTFEPEHDVLDTWATSSMTPQIALRWRTDPKFFEKMFPMNLRPQGHDIITFWLFNTIVKSHFHHNKLPWSHTMINGFVLAPGGGKMSKSKGNVMDPLVILDKYSADALRFWSASSRLGSDLQYQEKDLATGKKVMNKLWNASRLIEPHIQSAPTSTPTLWPTDHWLFLRLDGVIAQATQCLDQLEFSKAKAASEQFFMQDFCDQYLELVKDRLYNADKYPTEAAKSAVYTMRAILLSCLKLFAPYLPHITEEIYQSMFASTIAENKIMSIHQSSWPTPHLGTLDADSQAGGDLMIEILGAVRKFKSEHHLRMSHPLISLTIQVPGKEENILKPFLLDLAGATRATHIHIGSKETADIQVRDGLKIACQPEDAA